MAAFNDHHLGGACPTGADYFTCRSWDVDFRRGRHGWHQPSFCLQMGAAVSGARHRGIGRQSRSRSPARAAPGCPDGAARCQRLMRLPDEVSTVEGYKFREGVPALLEVRRLCIQGCCCDPCKKTTPAPLLSMATGNIPPSPIYRRTTTAITATMSTIAPTINQFRTVFRCLAACIPCWSLSCAVRCAAHRVSFSCRVSS